MINNNNASTAFNDFSQVPSIAYNLIEELIADKRQEAEDLWKVLAYSEVDCLDKPNLSEDEKTALIWTGDSLENNYSVFIKPLIGSAVDTAESQTQLRLYRYNTNPITRLEAIICYEADFITNEKTSLVRQNGKLVERSDLMESLFLSLMNGRDIALGSGYLTFDKELSRTCSSQLSINNSKTFYGRSLILALRFMGANVDGNSCG